MRIASKARFIGMLVAIMVVGAMLSAGCGGGGDKIDLSGKDNGNAASATKNSDNNGDNNAEPTAKATSESNGGSQSSGDADKYASQVCKAIGKYADDIQQLSDTNTDMEDPSAMKDFIDQMVPVMEGISKDLDKINPPDEVADWHNSMVSGMATAADLFSQMGDALDKPLDEAMADITDLSSQMSDMEDPFGSLGDLPDEYQTAFDNNSDCQDLENLDVFQ